MKVKAISVFVLAALGMSAAHAASFNVANNDVTLSGGIAGGAVYSENTGADDQGKFAVHDALLDLSVAPTKGVGATLGVGALAMDTVVNSGAPAVIGSFDVQYGWVTVKPTDGITVDAGKIATKIGYESATTFSNGNILLGGLWNAQPLYYPGARATFDVNADSSVFVEANQNQSSLGYVVGGSTAFSGVGISAAYADTNANAGTDIFDLIVSGEFGGVSVGANFDYHSLEKSVKGFDDSAFGLGLYVVPAFDAVTVPVRVEYFNDGTSGIYGGMDDGFSFTVTPTYNFTDSTYVRAELATVQAQNNIFTNSKNKAVDNKTSVAVQAGLRF